MNGPSLISITRLAPRVEINKQIFVIVYRSIFTGFTITISCFQVFYIFFILSFLFIFWLCLAFVFSGLTFLLYFLLFYIFSFLPISLYIFGLSISFIFWGFTLIFYILKFSIFSLLLRFSYVLYFELPVPAITEPTTVFLIPVMLKDWWLWWGNQKMGEYFYDLISLKLKYILYIQMIIKSQWKV